MTNKEWTTGEIQVLRTFNGIGAKALAQLLERSVNSIEHKARELRVSLEITPSDINVEQVTDKILIRLHEVTQLQVCPMCGKRMAVMRTGMCRCCHLDQLIALREEQLAEEIRLRKLTKIRQDKRRLRICETCGDAFYPRMTSKAKQCADCGGVE